VEALQALNALYADLRIFQSLFQLAMELVTKVRKGSRLIRRDDTPRIPLDVPEADPCQMAELELVRATTDPFQLSQRNDQHLERGGSNMNHRGGPGTSMVGLDAGERSGGWRPRQPFRTSGYRPPR
jgi:hypothetical protein